MKATAPVPDVQALHHRAGAAAHANRDWLEPVARAGYASRGIVYLLVGGLALLSVVGRGGDTGNQKDALRSVLEAPFGWILLAALAAGLACFALWRAIQVVAERLDSANAKEKRKAIFKRIGRGISAIAYASLGLAAAKLAWGYGTDSADATQSWTGWLMQQPFGRWLVAGVAACFFGAAVGQVMKAVKNKFEDELDVDHATMDKLRPICKLGLIARGLCFGIIGGFLLYAAWTYDASQAGGMRQVFAEVRSYPFGSVAVGVLAAGLFAFGIYGLVQAIWRRVL